QVGVLGTHAWICDPRRRRPHVLDQSMTLGGRGPCLRRGVLRLRRCGNQQSRTKGTDGNPGKACHKAPEGGGHLKNATGMKLNYSCPTKSLWAVSGTIQKMSVKCNFLPAAMLPHWSGNCWGKRVRI